MSSHHKTPPAPTGVGLLLPLPLLFWLSFPKGICFCRPADTQRKEPRISPQLKLHPKTSMTKAHFKKRTQPGHAIKMKSMYASTLWHKSRIAADDAAALPDIPSFDEDRFSIKVDLLPQLEQESPRKEALLGQMVVSGNHTVGI
jgi:hypothetical protein